MQPRPRSGGRRHDVLTVGLSTASKVPPPNPSRPTNHGHGGKGGGALRPHATLPRALSPRPPWAPAHGPLGRQHTRHCASFLSDVLSHPSDALAANSNVVSYPRAGNKVHATNKGAYPIGLSSPSSATGRTRTRARRLGTDTAGGRGTRPRCRRRGWARPPSQRCRGGGDSCSRRRGG